MNIKIRKATLNDLNVLLDFEQQLISVERPMDRSIEQIKKITYYDLNELITSNLSAVFVAINHNEIVGCGYGLIRQNKSKFRLKEHGYIGFIFVKPAFRGNEINKLLFKDIFNWFKTKNINEVRLTVYKENLSAIKAYKKIGFEENLVEMLYYLNPEQGKE